MNTPERSQNNSSDETEDELDTLERYFMRQEY